MKKYHKVTQFNEFSNNCFIIKKLNQQSDKTKNNLKCQVISFKNVFQQNNKKKFFQDKQSKIKANETQIVNIKENNTGILVSKKQALELFFSIALTLFCLSIPMKVQSCLTTEFLHSNGSCLLCQAYLAYCLECSSSTVCTNCPPTYYINTFSRCVSCTNLLHCLDCTSATNCINCTTGFYIGASGNCVSCTTLPNCILCSTATNCTKCALTFGYKPDGSCSLCSANILNCHTCNDTTKCLYCQAYYGLAVNDTCLPCDGISNCFNCTNYSLCTKCNSGFGLTLLSVCESCSTTMSYCAACANTTYCTECMSSFGLEVNNSCSPCNVIANCFTCLNVSQCVLCNPSFILATNKTCVSCSAISNCVTCSSISNCTECAAQFGLLLSGANYVCQSCSATFPNCFDCLNANSCLTCDAFFGMSAIPSCVSCSTLSNCLNCTSLPLCQICLPNFGLTTVGTCLSCTLILSCFDCIKATQCTVCLPSYGVSATFTCQSCNIIPQCVNCTTINHCINCQQYYGVSSVFDCQPCNLTINCVDCILLSQCIKCIAFYGVTPDYLCAPCTNIANCVNCSNSVTCVICTQTYFPDLGICIKCSVPNCRDCSTNTFCNHCHAKYYSVNGICFSCSLLPYCQACDNATVCTTCIKYYGMNMFGKCISCSNVVHCIDCLNITFCIECKKGYYLKSNGRCAQCPWPCSNCTFSTLCYSCYNQQMYLYDSSLKTCNCNRLFKDNGLCSNIDGCKKSQLLNKTQVCLFCDVSSKFSLVNGVCQCSKDYHSVLSKCVQICGDGKKYTQECDDGNNKDGDGCSALCLIQFNYRCDNGSSNHASHCVYIGPLPNFTLKSIDRKGHQNIGIFVVQIQPQLSFLQTNLQTNYVYFNSNASYSITLLKYINGLLTIQVTFASDLQKNDATLIMKYDPFFANITTNSTLTFPINSKYKNLLFLNNTSIVQNLQLAAIILVYVFLFIFIFGSLVQKMVGIQTLNVCQIIYFSLFLFQQNTPIINVLKQFHYSIGYTKYLNSYLNENVLNNKLTLLELDPFFIQNYFFIGIFQIGSLILFSIIATLNIYKKNKRKLKNLVQIVRKNNQKLQNVIQFLYEKILFTSTIGFLLINVISYSINQYDCIYFTQSNFILTNILLKTANNCIANICIYIAIIFVFFQLKKMLNNVAMQQNKLWKTNYVILFVLFQILITSGFVQQLLSLENLTTKYFLLVCIGLYSFIIVIYQPYKQKFNNIVLVFNNVGLFLYFICLNTRPLFKNYLETFDYYLILLTISWLTLVCFFAIIRIYIFIKFFYLSKKMQFKEPQKRYIQTNTQMQNIQAHNRSVQKNILMSNIMNYNAQILNKKLQRVHLFNQQRQKKSMISMPINLTFEQKSYLQPRVREKNSIKQKGRNK